MSGYFGGLMPIFENRSVLHLGRVELVEDKPVYEMV